MPMCNIYLPAGSLSTEAEAALVAAVSESTIQNEFRRTAELTGEDEKAFSLDKLRAMAWMYVLRPELMYAGGEPAEAPCYKFEFIVPKGYVDERFTTDMTRGVYDALAAAEEGKPDLQSRLRVFINEVEDGHWGTGTRATGLKATVDAIRN